MAEIVASVLIRRPIEIIYDYVTTPANWPDWHPASLSVSGNTGRSLELGDEVVEEFKAAGYRGRARWRVIRRRAPYLWSIEALPPEGGFARIEYALSAENGGVLFERELTYKMPNRWLALLDRCAIRRRIAGESRLALGQLKHILEAAPVPVLARRPRLTLVENTVAVALPVAEEFRQAAE
jgi:hypothetical protein